MFKKKKSQEEIKEEEIKEVFEDFGVDYHYRNLELELSRQGYKIICLKIKKNPVKVKVLEDCD